MADINNLLDGKFPSTRFSGSKRRLLPILHDIFRDLDFESAADLFSGSSSVAYLLKKLNKHVLANDYLHSNHLTALALVENNNVRLSVDDIQYLTDFDDADTIQDGIISRTFRGFYFTAEENIWLDTCHAKIESLVLSYDEAIARYKKALAYHALFQSALRKRPFNLFHRKNLYIRTNPVERNFGNATTWERPFSSHFRELATEANELVFQNDYDNKAYCNDAAVWMPPDTDLVYMDPPYVNLGASKLEVDYLTKYHFLEGLARYDEWDELIDWNSPLLAVQNGYRTWPGGSGNSEYALIDIFRMIFEKYPDRIMVMSYSENGLPSSETLAGLMKDYKLHVYIHRVNHKYALRKPSTENQSTEVVIVGVDYRVPGWCNEVLL